VRIPGKTDRRRILTRLRRERILVILGGRSRERQISFRSGYEVGAAILKLGLRPRMIDPVRGIPRGPALALICLHGKGGEDGNIQRILNERNIVFPTTGGLSSYLCHDKIFATRIAGDIGIRVPRQEIYKRGGEFLRARTKAPRFPGPYVIKPAREGSSFGIHMVSKWEKIPSTAFSYPDIFVEKFIEGRELTQSILILKDKITILPLLELKTLDEPYYNLKAKYTPGAVEFVLGPKLPRKAVSDLARFGMKLAIELNLRGIARIDYRMDRRGKVYFLEVNTIPGLTKTSDFPAQARAAGISAEDLALLLLDEALRLKNAAV